MAVPAVVVATVVTLPLACGQPAGFLRAVVELQFTSRLRPEALSYLGLLAGPGGQPRSGPAWRSRWRRRSWRWRCGGSARTPAGFALGVAALFLAFFVLNKPAFANYYFFVIGALCVAVAATERRWRPGRRRSLGGGSARPAGPGPNRRTRPEHDGGGSERCPTNMRSSKAAPVSAARSAP